MERQYPLLTRKSWLEKQRTNKNSCWSKTRQNCKLRVKQPTQISRSKTNSKTKTLLKEKIKLLKLKPLKQNSMVIRLKSSQLKSSSSERLISRGITTRKFNLLLSHTSLDNFLIVSVYSLRMKTILRRFSFRQRENVWTYLYMWKNKSTT